MQPKTTWTFDTVEIIDVPESFGKIFKLTNVKMTCVKKDAKTIHIKGKKFLGEALYYIWHYMYDNLVQYLYLKKHIKDLDYWTFIPHELHDGTREEFFNQIKRVSFHNVKTEDLDPYPHKYHEDIFDIFVNQDYFYTTNNYNLVFDEVYFCFDYQRLFTYDKKMITSGKQFFHVNYAYWYPDNWEERANKQRAIFNETWWRDIGMLEMKKIFMEKLKDYPTDTPKKIFISRKDSLARHSMLADKTAARLHPIALEELVEDCFVNAGYTPLTLEGMGYLEQLNLFRNADRIAGVVGSGFCQTFISNTDSIISPIYVNNNYDFSYDFIVRNTGAKLNNIDIRPLMSQKEKIKMSIEKNIAFMDAYVESRQNASHVPLP